MPSWGTIDDRRRQFELWDDFLFDNGQWTAVTDGSTGAATITDAPGGVLTLATAGADNDYHIYASDAEVFKFAAGKPLQFGAQVKLTEAATDDANIVAGLSDDATGGVIQNNGGGPPASYDGALFYKIDGTLKWYFETSNAGTQTTTELGTFTSGTAYELGLDFKTSSTNDTLATITPTVNGKQYESHTLTLSGLEEMHVLFGVKAGGSNAETLSVNWIGCRQYR